MTKTELKKISIAADSYLTRYLHSKTDFNHAFFNLLKELGLLEQIMKDFILTTDDKKLLKEVFARDYIIWTKFDDSLYYRCLGGLID